MTKKPKTITQVMVPMKDLMAAMGHSEEEPAQVTSIPVKPSPASGYRQQALKHYKREIGGVQVNVCVMCGFGIPSVLEIAHLDQDRKNNAVENLATLCPNCHKMHDIGLIPTEVITRMRDEELKENWRLRIKDAGAKAALTKRTKAAAKKKSLAGKRAWQTRTGSGQPEPAT